MPKTGQTIKNIKNNEFMKFRPPRVGLEPHKSCLQHTGFLTKRTFWKAANKRGFYHELGNSPTFPPMKSLYLAVNWVEKSPSKTVVPKCCSRLWVSTQTSPPILVQRR